MDQEMRVGVLILVLLSAYLFFYYPVTAKQLREITAIYSFGASCADTGSHTAAFASLPLPYGSTFFGKRQRFSDGRLVIDFLTEHLGFPYLSAYVDSIETEFGHGANFATGGSTIQALNVDLFNHGNSPFTLGIQLFQFQRFKARTLQSYSRGRGYSSKISLPKPESFSGALYTFDHGQNDLHAGLVTKTEKEVIASIPYMIDNYTVVIKQLYLEGARSFWIHNVGPIGCLPWFVANYPPEPGNVDRIGCIRSYNDITKLFNKQLKNLILELRNVQFRDATFFHVDMYSIKYSLISRVTELGFVDPLGSCFGKMRVIKYGEEDVLVNGTEICVCKNASEYINWDGIHYTDAANKWIFNQILSGSFSEPQFTWLKPVMIMKK